MQLQGTCLFSKQGGQARKRAQQQSGRVGGLACLVWRCPFYIGRETKRAWSCRLRRACCLHRFKAPSKMGRVSTTQHQRSVFSGVSVSLGVRELREPMGGFPWSDAWFVSGWPGGLGRAGWRCTWVRSLCRSCRARAHRRLNGRSRPANGSLERGALGGGSARCQVVRCLSGLFPASGSERCPFGSKLVSPAGRVFKVVPSWCCAGPLVRQLLVVPLQSRPRRNMRRGWPLFCHSCRDADQVARACWRREYNGGGMCRPAKRARSGAIA